MFSIIVLIAVFFGGSIMTVQAADKAKPGDTLYALDRAVENLQIVVSSKEKRDELKVKFAAERVAEMQDIVDQAIESIQNLKEIEVKIYTDKALVKAETTDDKHFKFSLQSTDQAEIITLLAERFATSADDIKAVVKFELKDEAIGSGDED